MTAVDNVTGSGQHELKLELSSSPETNQIKSRLNHDKVRFHICTQCAKTALLSYVFDKVLLKVASHCFIDVSIFITKTALTAVHSL